MPEIVLHAAARLLAEADISQSTLRPGAPDLVAERRIVLRGMGWNLWCMLRWESAMVSILSCTAGVWSQAGAGGSVKIM